MADGQVYAFNRQIAANYDALVYNPKPVPLLDAAKVCGLASLFSAIRPPLDVLDLGCGTGVQMARLAGQVAGRLVGTDISERSCQIASERLAPFGERAGIICADLLELDSGKLGTFDLIYNIGVIYVVPQEVRRQIIALIGGCLRPGGVAVLSYYAGSLAAIRAQLCRTLRADCRGMAHEAAIQRVRRRLASLVESIKELAGADMLRLVLADIGGQSDVVLFHEVLNGVLEPVQTSALAQELSEYGLTFASYLPPAGLDATLPPQARALAADMLDFRAGRYRYAVFVKQLPAVAEFAGRPDFWESSLKRETRGDLTGEQAFAYGDRNVVTLRNPASNAMFDCLMDGPLSWPLIVEKVAGMLADAGLEFDQESRQLMEADLRNVWRHGFLSALSGKAEAVS